MGRETLKVIGRKMSVYHSSLSKHLLITFNFSKRLFVTLVQFTTGFMWQMIAALVDVATFQPRLK